ncbi:hypothetical protein [Poseidonocella sp. HB161398]|uniref:hypothetical protein n=1 Tax=Poseidonocella sp. HB161398 TaxID=2320855 RepID=UPI001107C802|nr:hypothetical protein [Poseidonocella sp. HB161398]
MAVFGPLDGRPLRVFQLGDLRRGGPGGMRPGQQVGAAADMGPHLPAAPRDLRARSERRTPPARVVVLAAQLEGTVGLAELEAAAGIGRIRLMPPRGAATP